MSYQNLSEVEKREQDFHNKWAQDAKSNSIDVISYNTAQTSPELRYITRKTGLLNEKRILEIGSGLGETAVYFALKGAIVTATDLSPEMCNSVRKLAKQYNTKVETIILKADDFAPLQHRRFDIIYISNTLHHVNIKKTMTSILPLLSQNGMFISWDPIKYNPIINVYRKIATNVRTPDEKPFSKDDINYVASFFKKVDVEYFWFTSLLIFILMFLTGNNPNKQRFWKQVVIDSQKWAGLHKLLEKADKQLMKISFLRKYCWNVVILGYGKRNGN